MAVGGREVGVDQAALVKFPDAIGHPHNKLLQDRSVLLEQFVEGGMDDPLNFFALPRDAVYLEEAFSQRYHVQIDSIVEDPVIDYLWDVTIVEDEPGVLFLIYDVQ